MAKNEIEHCCKCDAVAVTDDNGDPMCARCYDALPEIDDRAANT